MPAKDGFEFTEGDLDLVHSVYEVRLATIEHLAALLGRSEKALRARVLKLKDRRYVAPVRRWMQKTVFGLGPEGQAALVEAGYAPREFAERRLRHNELKDLGIRHALFIADIHTKLIVLTRTGPISITNWVEGPSLWDSVPTHDEQGRGIVIPIRPDAWFTLQHAERPEGKNKLHYFLEADRGTMSHQRMKEKARGYTAYFQQQRHMKKYGGMKMFQVATVTETKRRATELANTFRTMMEPAWLRAYPVIAFEDLTIEALLPSK
jgi:hypothetical protein